MNTAKVLLRKSYCGIIFIFLLSALAVDAAESMKTSDAVQDVKTDTKKSVRTLKRHGRKAVGTDSAAKDVKDKVSDVQDDLEGSAHKVKNRMKIK